MITSILTSVKKTLNLTEDYEAFDQDVILHTNAVFSILNQLGVGPPGGFAIEDKEPVWDAFLEGDPRSNDIKSYVYLRVRMLFDPPTTGYLTTAMEKQIEEFGWRINARREDTEWVDPVTRLPMDGGTLDGGGP